MHVGSISLTRDQTRDLCIGSAESSYPLDHQGSPNIGMILLTKLQTSLRVHQFENFILQRILIEHFQFIKILTLRLRKVLRVRQFNYPFCAGILSPVPHEASAQFCSSFSGEDIHLPLVSAISPLVQVIVGIFKDSIQVLTLHPQLSFHSAFSCRLS